MDYFKNYIVNLVLTGLLICLTSSLTLGQNIKIKGTVIDSTTNPMIAATVVLLQPQDSIMVSYAITGNQGQFVLNGIAPGEYYLQVTYIGFGNFRQLVTVKESPAEQNLGAIFLSPSNTMLEEVVVKAEHVPIVIKNDTIEYNADAFKTKPNAAVEELLRRLPGVEVQRDGSIKAQGEDVENVLVDGKEFFGNDTKIATQNLPADIVDKVQVYDKKSEMAEFSGIDDGNEEKTINLSLKEGKKKGYFGNIEGGIGSDDLGSFFDNKRYKGKASINRFDNKLQLSILGMANNINDAGFSFNDYINFMGGMGSFMGGGMSMNTQDLGIPLGYDNSPGITNTAAGGLNFNYDFNDKTEWQSSYFINRIDNRTIQSINSQNLGGLQSFERMEDSDRNNTNLNHRLNSSLRLKMDSTSNLTWINRLSFNTRDLSSSSSSQTLGFDKTLENQSLNENISDGKQISWFSGLTLRKKLNKPGRILSGSINLTLGNNNGNAHVDNETTLFENADPAIVVLNLQDQISDEEQTDYGIRVSYTEPLSKKTFLGFNINRSNSKNERVRNYFDLDPDNPSSRVLNTQLSNQYQRNYTYNQIGSTIRYNGKTLRFSSGVNLQLSELNGSILSENINLDKSFTYILPSLSLDYEIGTSKNLEFNYRTRIQEPGLQQLQPIVDNSNPLNLYQGNPELKPEYIHEANIHLMLFDQFSFTSFFANFNTRYTLNRIVNKSTIDDQFRQIINPINTDYNFSSSAYVSYGTPLKFIKSKVSIDVNLGYNKGILFANGLKNNTNRWTNNYTLTFENRKKEVVDLAVGMSLGISDVSYSESKEFNQNYLDQTYFSDLTLYLPKNWSFESTLDYTRYSKESFGDKDDLVLWQLKLSKNFLKNDRGTLELIVFDVLNQNQGINRNNNLNYIQESRTNVLGRYIMLGVNYKLSKFGGDGGMHVEMRRR
jgi:hypothetical protein